MLEGFARDKHSSLLWKSANYGHNKFYITGPTGLLDTIPDLYTLLQSKQPLVCSPKDNFKLTGQNLGRVLTPGVGKPLKIKTA
jgi:hypothetical protein